MRATTSEEGTMTYTLSQEVVRTLLAALETQTNHEYAFAPAMFGPKSEPTKLTLAAIARARAALRPKAKKKGRVK